MDRDVVCLSLVRDYRVHCPCWSCFLDYGAGFLKDSARTAAFSPANKSEESKWVPLVRGFVTRLGMNVPESGNGREVTRIDGGRQPAVGA
jgi:uncharacterized protein YgiB involved in biofilm formation